jgi:hypothetical protein
LPGFGINAYARFINTGENAACTHTRATAQPSVLATTRAAASSAEPAA